MSFNIHPKIRNREAIQQTLTEYFSVTFIFTLKGASIKKRKMPTSKQNFNFKGYITPIEST
jgi:hypothetical protein